MCEQLPNPDHEEFAAAIAKAICSEDGTEYHRLMNSPENPLKQDCVTRDQVRAIHQRVHWLAEREGDV